MQDTSALAKGKETIAFFFIYFKIQVSTHIVHATRISTGVSHWFNYFCVFVLFFFSDCEKRMVGCVPSLGSAWNALLHGIDVILAASCAHIDRINQKCIMDQWLFTSQWCLFNRVRQFSFDHRSVDFDKKINCILLNRKSFTMAILYRT